MEQTKEPSFLFYLEEVEMENKNIVVTCSEMKEIEKKAAEGGLSYYQMMENAGSEAAKFIMSKNPILGKNILIFCGKGNNGGDGFVVARKLFEDGAKVKLVIVDGEPKTQDAIKNKELCDDLQIPIIQAENNIDCQNIIQTSDIIVDAIYGTGFYGELKDGIRRITKWINSTGVTVFALDIPSGLNGDSGKADKDSINANYTIAFHSFKPVHMIEEAQKYCGQIICVDIGIHV